MSPGLLSSSIARFCATHLISYGIFSFPGFLWPAERVDQGGVLQEMLLVQNLFDFVVGAVVVVTFYVAIAPWVDDINECGAVKKWDEGDVSEYIFLLNKLPNSGMRLPSNAGRKPPFWDRRFPRRLTTRRRRVGRRRIFCRLRLSLAIVMVDDRSWALARTRHCPARFVVVIVVADDVFVDGVVVYPYYVSN